MRRPEARQAEATELVGEVTYCNWRLYMAASAYGFESGRINVNQTLLAKPDACHGRLILAQADGEAVQHANSTSLSTWQPVSEVVSQPLPHHLSERSSQSSGFLQLRMRSTYLRHQFLPAFAERIRMQKLSKSIQVLF